MAHLVPATRRGEAGGRAPIGWGTPAVVATATAADLIAARMGATAAERKAALRRVKFDGDPDAVEAMRRVFSLTGDPGLLVA